MSRPMGGRPAGAALGALAVAVPVAGVVAGQAIRVQRRHGAAPEPGPIDVTVSPAAGGSSAVALELAAFGDSSVAGVGVRRTQDALPVQLAQRVVDDVGRPVHVTGMRVRVRARSTC